MFFVISGFLITRQLFGEASVRGRINLLRFYSARFRRLLPPVALVVACTLALAHFVLPYDQMRSLVRDAYYSAFYGINYHFAHEGVQYQNATAPPSALQHFWSLAVEEQFYVLWPLLIIVCAVIARRRYRRAVTLTLIVAISVTTLVYCIATSGSNRSLAYFSLQTRAWELGFGALVALTAERWARLPARLARVLGWSGLTAILVSAVAYSDATVYPGVAALLPVSGATLLIGSGVLRNSGTPETALLERPWMQYGGKVSYAWYLWHWPMLILLPAWVGHSLNTWENTEIVGLAFWLAVLTYFLENAAHRSSWSPAKWARTGTVLSASVAGCAFIAGALMPSLATNGVSRQTTALKGADLTAVQAALNRSAGITELPRNLTPSLTQAATDTPVRKSRCLTALTATVSPMCVFGDTHSAKTAVLLGDSHADQWITPLSELAAEKRWKLVELTKAACPVANVRVFETDLKRDYTECDTYRRWLTTEVRKLDPSLIIASQANSVPWTSITDQTWADKTVQALASLAGQHAQVRYVGDTPTTMVNELTCLQQNIKNATKCLYLRSAAFGPFSARYSILGRTLARSGVGYVDTLNFFCNPSICPSVVDNMVVHRDEGHITNTYASWLKPMLQPIFAGA